PREGHLAQRRGQGRCRVTEACRRRGADHPPQDLLMSFTERVTIFIEAKVDNAKSSLSGFKQSVAQAEGATGKLKAAASGLGSAVSGAVGAIASPAGLAAVGTAVVGFAVKSVSAFENLGLAAGK